MEAATLLRCALDGTREFNRLVGTEVHELDGVTAAVVPSCPERSVVNAVCYDDPVRLEAALDDLVAIYDAAAVHAWTVWVPPEDRKAAGMREEAGHVLDAAPEAMGMGLEAVSRPSDFCNFTREADLRAIALLNDRAYGYEGSFERALRELDPGTFELYAAHLDGRPASCCVTVARESDCHVTLVATLPEARGRGLGGGLLAHALADARERGLRTSSLVATKLGRPVYERLGYRGVGQIEMWERRLR